MSNQTKPTIEGYETGPSPDFDEFDVGAGVLDVGSIGGYPVRSVEVVTAGGGTIKVKTAASPSTYRTASGLAAKDAIGPLQITSIAGSTDGTTVTKVRVYK